MSAKNERSLRDAQTKISEAAEQLASVLSIVEGESDQDKASEDAEAKSGASGEEPPGVKPSAPVEEPKSSTPVARLAAQANIYALTGAGRGSQ